MKNVRQGNVDIKNANSLNVLANLNALYMSVPTLRALDVKKINPVMTQEELNRKNFEEINNNIGQAYTDIKPLDNAFTTTNINPVNMGNNSFMPNDLNTQTNMNVNNVEDHSNLINPVTVEPVQNAVQMNNQTVDIQSASPMQVNDNNENDIPVIKPVNNVETPSQAMDYDPIITPFNNGANLQNNVDLQTEPAITPLSNTVPNIESTLDNQDMSNNDFNQNFVSSESDQVNAAINSEILSPRAFEAEPRREVYTTIETPQEQTTKVDPLIETVIMIEDTRKALSQKAEEMKRDAIREIDNSVEELKTKVTNMIDKRISLLKNELNDGLTEVSRNVENVRSSHQNDMNAIREAISKQNDIYSINDINNTYGRAA